MWLFSIIFFKNMIVNIYVCIQIGVGLMFLQQLSGSAGVTYYASSLFQKGGNLVFIHIHFDNMCK